MLSWEYVSLYSSFLFFNALFCTFCITLDWNLVVNHHLGPLDCFRQTLRSEGALGLYKAISHFHSLFLSAFSSNDVSFFFFFFFFFFFVGFFFLLFLSLFLFFFCFFSSLSLERPLSHTPKCRIVRKLRPTHP